MTILSVFAGRKSNIEILKKYLQKALELKIIDEVHFWNNTRNAADEAYLKSMSHLKRSSSSGDGTYCLIHPVLVDQSFELKVRAPNDIHIKLTNASLEYEIVLGGWSNTRSVIRENNREICSLVQPMADGNQYHTFKVVLEKNRLVVLKNEEIVLQQSIQPFELEHIYFKTGHRAVGDLTYSVHDHGFYFMDTCEKSWKNYYAYYTDETYKEDIILKCDDDIVFIDLSKLPEFIEFVKQHDYDLVFANTINNGVSAYFQQHMYNLIPPEIMQLEYPEGGLRGTLWESGQKAGALHHYFLDHYESFLHYDYKKDILPIHTRFSINFFAYKGSKWHKIQDCAQDDEAALTVEYVKHRNFKNVFYSEFYVSHLSFCKQTLPPELLERYHALYENIHGIKN